jgi:predicted deacetylase
MEQKRTVTTFFAIIFVLGCVNGEYANDSLLTRENPEIWAEIHDVGANYELPELKKVIEILEKHPKAYEKVVLMVIPNYGGKYPFHENSEFSRYLRELQSEGYILAVHGYAHVGEEFKVPRDMAEEIIRRADDEFNKSGFETSEVFLPPRWTFSSESLDIATKRFEEVYTDNGIYLNGSFLRYPVHEYTNESHDFTYDVQFEQAQKDYLNTKGVFRLSMHLAFASSEKHLRLLDDFLAWSQDMKAQSNTT